tara:strand:+ start:124 stop:804 length:681 start_codon:yes stop_codon:yes gene_type:complete
MAVLENRFMRNKDLIDQQLLDSVMVIGLGGIGSTVVTLLSIMGFNNIIAYDDDKLEEHNLSSTTYPTSYIGKTKVMAAHDTSMEYSNRETRFHGFEERWDDSKKLNKNVITCLDNMDTRMEVYEAWCKMPHRQLLIDLRMDALSFEMVTSTREYDEYDKYWVTDAEIEPAPCTMKHTIFASSIIGGLGVNQVFNCLANKPYYGYIWGGLLPLNLQKENLIKPKIME